MERTLGLRPETSSEAEFSVKRSRFIATVQRADDQQQAKDFLDEVCRSHFSATHNCWAWRGGFPQDLQQSSDAGEPSGTAGRPILGEILKRDATDCIVVVTRYFGGIKLGVRGLIDAYSAAATMALERATFEIVEACQLLTLKTDYCRSQEIKHLLKTCGIDEKRYHVDYQLEVTFYLQVPLPAMVQLRQTVSGYDWASKLIAAPLWGPLNVNKVSN